MGMGVHPAELASLIQQHAAALELFAAQWTRFPADAVQEAFISLAAERPVPTHPRAWLYKVVRFKAMDQARAESRRKNHEGCCAEQRSEWFIPGKECSLEMDETVAALKTLPVEQRETIVLRDAETRNLSQEAWTSLLTEHMKAFRRIVGNNPSDPMAPATIVASSYPRAKRELIAEGYSRERIQGMPAAQVIAIHEAQVLRRVSDDLFKWSLLPYHEADGWTKTVRIYSFDPFRERAESLPIGSQLLPAVMAAAQAEVRLHTELDGLRTVEAIRMQMHESGGRLPAALEDIQVVPVPKNPATNKAFIYRPLDAGAGRVLQLVPGKDPPAPNMWNIELRPAKQ